jgi:hypothetical protein
MKQQYSQVVGLRNTAVGQYATAYGMYNTQKTMEDFVNALNATSSTVDSVAESLKGLQQYIYDQLGTASSVITENPNQNKGLEISNQIEVSEEFLNMKIDN